MNGTWPQPGGRRPAPGALALVQAFLNTHYDLEHDHGAEVLSSPEALGRWLTRHGVSACRPAQPADLERALELRAGLRELARANGGPAPAAGPEPFARISAAVAGGPVEVRFTPQGPSFGPAPDSPGVSGALGVLAARAAAAMLEGTWPRLKICPGRDCDWAFYDHSRNGNGRWCSMSVCGGRAKARAHYTRRRAEARRP